MSGGLVALGLIATAAGVRTACYAFALILLPTLGVVGVVTFSRVLQCAIADYCYAIPNRAVARLLPRALARTGRVHAQRAAHATTDIQGVGGGHSQRFLTVAAMVALVTAVLLGSAVGLVAALVFHHPLVVAIVAGVLGAGATLTALINVQSSTWRREATRMLTESRAGRTQLKPRRFGLSQREPSLRISGCSIVIDMRDGFHNPACARSTGVCAAGGFC